MVTDDGDEQWVIVDDPDDWRLLTPLGPGGRPMARWRPLTALLALVALVGLGIVMLSDRAPGVLGDASERIAVRVDERVPEARQNVREAVTGTPAQERDVQAHVVLWAGATVLLGLSSWSWRSLVVLTLLAWAASTALELAQGHVAPTRITEQSDLVANTVGVLIGVVATLVVTGLIGLPSRLRGRRADGEHR